MAGQEHTVWRKASVIALASSFRAHAFVYASTPVPFPRSDLGQFAARALARSWRRTVPPIPLKPEEISAITPLAISAGSAALLWRAINETDSSDAENLRAVYRYNAINAGVHEIHIADIFERMGANGVEPILFKGWGLARLYPDAGFRPYGDLDLWIRGQELEAAKKALPAGEHLYCVELHTSFYDQYERSFDQVMSCSQLVRLHDVDVRIPCAEDHLRFICMHFLFHGGWRPLWLCDVALMIESRAPDFDWDRCLSGKRKYADWIACVIGLAHQLIGADIAGIPVTRRAHNLPRWLAPAILRQWGEEMGMSFAEEVSFSIKRDLGRPLALPKHIKSHWRNPVQASVEMDAWLDDRWRMPLQAAAGLGRLSAIARRSAANILKS